MLKPKVYQPKTAISLLENASKRTADAAVSHRVELRLAEVLIWHQDDHKRAVAILKPLLKKTQSDKAMRRRCLTALGDAALIREDSAEAHRRYELALDLVVKPISQPQELARTGSYPYTVEDLIARGEFDWALRILDQWENEFPLQKIEGYSLFLRGKTLFVQNPCEMALRYLELSERVSPRALHVTEAVWLRANCLMEIGRFQLALAQFARLHDDLTASAFLERSMEKIKQCQTAIQSKGS